MSTISVPTTRQFPLSVVSTFTYEDVVGTTAVALFGMQVGSMITQLNLVITTSFAGGTTHDADFGDATTADRYNATIVELDGTALANPANPPTITGASFSTTSAEPSLLMTPTSTGGDPTSGAADLYATYIVKGRAHENYEV
jgi:hypothetical protein